MTKSEIEQLKDGYYAVRQESAALREDGAAFEGLPWLIGVDRIERHNETLKTRLIVYHIEDEIEVCIGFPDKTSKTYC